MPIPSRMRRDCAHILLLLSWLASCACTEFPASPFDAGVDTGAGDDAAGGISQDAAMPEEPGSDESDALAPGCEADDLNACPELLGAIPVDCVSGSCLYVCQNGRADRNGDLARGPAGNTSTPSR